MAKSFMAAIQPTLTEIDAWSAEISHAWENLFILITFGMRRGFSVSRQKIEESTAEESPLETVDDPFQENHIKG